MKLKLSRFTLLVFALFTYMGMQAQNQQKVNLQDETQVSLSLDKLRKLSFDTEYMYVTLESKENFSYSLENMRSAIFFTDVSTSVETVELAVDFELTAFPNPVQEVLRILLPTNNAMPGNIMLYNNKGQLIQNIAIKDEVQISIDVSGLTSGLYLCIYRSEGISKSVKFIKN